MAEKFWLVWDEAGHMPRFKYGMRHAAIAEAKRLAREWRGQTFHVLEVIQTITTVDISRTEYDRDDDDVPF